MKLTRYAFFALLLVFVACSDDDTGMNPVDPMDPDVTIWSGPTLTFTKIANADPGDAANQDRITDDVWITRGTSGGQIYNARIEGSADKNTSPAGTLWAIGTTDNLSSLNLVPFRSAVGSPKDVAGKNLVMFLENEKIAIDVKFTSWAQSGDGGFSYERSTEN